MDFALIFYLCLHRIDGDVFRVFFDELSRLVAFSLGQGLASANIV